jgi:hypothetical protein
MRKSTGKTPTLTQPKPEVADIGAVRLGSSTHSADLPTLKFPDRDVADKGTVRLGSSTHSADLPT